MTTPRVSKWRPGGCHFDSFWQLWLSEVAFETSFGCQSCQMNNFVKLYQTIWYQIWVVMVRTFWLSMLTTLTTFWMTTIKLSLRQHIWRLFDNLAFCVLGGSHSRTKEMATRAKELTSSHLQSLPRTSLVIFTDGSSLENPGPCGSSAIIYTHGLAQEPVVLKRPVSTKSSAFHGELRGRCLYLFCRL